MRHLLAVGPVPWQALGVSPGDWRECETHEAHLAGGFGLLMTSKLVDETHFNEFGNEVFLVKHLE